MTKEYIDLQLSSADFTFDEATKLLKRYREAKTEHEKNQLIPLLKQMYGKMVFELEATKKLMEL